MWPVFKSNFKSVKVVYLTPVPDLHFGYFIIKYFYERKVWYRYLQLQIHQRNPIKKLTFSDSLQIYWNTQHVLDYDINNG